MGKNKKLRKSIESFEERIKEHEKKIKEHIDENNFLMEYWEKEIKHFKRKKEEQERKLNKE